MVCIYCEGTTQVINSRHQRRSNIIWRRRKCHSCGVVFTTRETTDYAGSLRVSDREGALMPFSRDKLLLSLYKSLQHRPTAISDASALVDTVISRLVAQLQHSVVNDQNIVTTAYLVLARFDPVASVHYQAFHSE